MLSYELAKQLKDAGFPMKRISSMLYPPKINETTTSMDIVEHFRFPTLSELIEACGEGFYGLFTIWDKGCFNKRWVAIHRNLPNSINSFEKETNAYSLTPEETVARLWLELNKK